MTFKFTKKDFQDPSLMVVYNTVTNTKTALAYEFDGETYILYDSYCKNPNCQCQLVSLILSKKAALNDEKRFSYNYLTQSVEDADPDLPKALINKILENKVLIELFKERHKLIRAAFLQQLLLSFDKANRNDPCPCGSGKKFKKCHGLA
jgi:uncharacterized protein YchJ